MLHGTKVELRARQESDVSILHAELYDDVELHSRAGIRPWRPVAANSAASPYAVGDPADDAAKFAVVELASGELAGSAVMWGMDTVNSGAHLGIVLRPAYRGRGLATDVIRLLCHYGFTVLGLHRLQIETLADNAPMLHTAEQAGFVREGTLRHSSWVLGEFADKAILGLLATEWPGY